MTARQRLAVLVSGAVLFAVPAGAQTISIVTTPTGSFTNSAGAAIAKVIVENTKYRAIVQAQAQAAVMPVHSGIAEFGMSNTFDPTFFVTGTGIYEGQGKHPNLRQVAIATTYRVALHVRADSAIKTIPDVKDKRVSSGFVSQKTIGRTISALLANGALTYDDVQQVLAPNVSSSANDFIANKVDVLFFAMGSAPVKQAAASVGGLRVLPLDDSAEAMGRMRKILPGVHALTVDKASNLDGVTGPTKVLALDMAFFTHKDVPDDIVYAVTKAMHGNKASLVATFRAMSLFDPNQMAKPVQDLPFHPGALRFYKEIGLAPKS
ncbi:MAG: TAXI family TRAP transporter solute-binding subunit [Rhizobiales bacterium]|nr:TAXI family TRAP transporter solute-binding subunit [Hyphomicrobiales bacterium]